MAVQAREVDELKRRAREAAERRRRNLSRIEEGRRGERERDKTILKARVIADEVKEVEEEARVGESKNEGTTGAVKTVKRKKKARQAEIQ